MAQLMFDDIIEGLKLTKCPYQPPDVPALKNALGGNKSSKMYAQVIVWITAELCGICPVGEAVTMPVGPEEEPIFRVELSALLKDLECPAPGLGGAESLTDPSNRTYALHFLLHELMACQMSAINNSTKEKVSTETGCFSGHPALSDLALIYHVLEMPQPPPNATTTMIFDDIVKKLLDRSSEKDKKPVGDPLLKLSLSPELWTKFEELCHVMNEEYTTRFSTLLKRIDLTITAFKWSKFAKDKCGEIDKLYMVQRNAMQDKSSLSIADVLAARTDLLMVGRTSSGVVRNNTKSNINNMVIVGKVPDRGGRPHEQRPEPEIPSWMKDKKGQGRGGRGGFSQQSRGGRFQASQGRQHTQQPREQAQNDRYQRPYDRRGSAGGRGSSRGGPAGARDGYQGGGGGWGGYSRGYSRGGGSVY